MGTELRVSLFLSSQPHVRVISPQTPAVLPPCATSPNFFFTTPTQLFFNGPDTNYFCHCVFNHLLKMVLDGEDQYFISPFVCFVALFYAFTFFILLLADLSPPSSPSPQKNYL